MQTDSRPVLSICDDIAVARLGMPDQVNMPLLKAQAALHLIASGARERGRGALIEVAALIVASIQRMDENEQPDGFNPHGSGPVPVGLRMSERRAVLEGPPSGMRADIAERCARAGFACSFLPARGLAGALHITLVGKPGAGKSALLNGIADAGYVVRERRPIKDRGEVAEAAVIYGRGGPTAASVTAAQPAEVA